MTKDEKKQFKEMDDAIHYLLDKLSILQGFLLSEAVAVHIMEHGRICKDCVRRLADELGVDRDYLIDADIELAYLNSKGRC